MNIEEMRRIVREEIIKALKDMAVAKKEPQCDYCGCRGYRNEDPRHFRECRRKQR